MDGINEKNMNIRETGNLNWWQEPIAILGHTYFNEEGEAPEEIVRRKREMGFDAEHWLGCHDILVEAEGGDTGRGYLFKTRAGYKRDDLSPYLQAARKYGLRVIVYVNVHWFNSKFGEQYFIRDADGTAVGGYGSGYLVCPAGPFLDWAKVVAEDLGGYGVDGVFLDGPMSRTCYCESCRRLFRERYGSEMPADTATMSGQEREWMRQFSRDKVTRFLKSFRDAFTAVNPDGMVYHNGETLGKPGFINEAAAEVVDLLGIEGGFLGYSPLRPQYFFAASATAKLCQAQAGGKPSVIFIDYAFKGFDYYSHSEAEIMRMFASTVANNANPWFLMYRDDITPGMEAGMRMSRFIGANRRALAGTESLARVGLLYSGRNIQLASEQPREGEDDVHATGRHGGAGITGSHLETFQGVYAALSRSQVPFDIVTERTLPDAGKRYDLLILPGIMAMDEQTAGEIQAFVKAGGNLLALFDTSLYDENGVMRNDYLLNDLFGCSAGTLNAVSNLDYIHAGPGNFLTDKLTQTRIPCPELSRYISAVGDKQTPLAFYYERMPRRYAELPPVSDRPAGILNRYGHGRVLFLPHDLGSCYLKYSFPEHRELLANAVRELSSVPVRLEGGCSVVEVTLRRNGQGQILLHLINLTGAERPAEGVVPLRDIRITLDLGREFKQARAAYSETKLTCRNCNGLTEIALPVLQNYELLVIE